MRQGLYTIPSGSGFLKCLAQGLFNKAETTLGNDEFTLSRMRVLLPTRRACRELRDALMRLSSNKPLLLPKLQSIGDVDAEELELYLSGFGDMGHDIPPAISSLERQFLLAKLIQARDTSLNVDSALLLAKDLSRLIDTVHTEDLDFSGLTKIVPENLAVHWQRTLDFLTIVTEFWPNILKERGQIDPSDRRNRLLKSLATLWQNHPPETPIIAAGSTGSIPSSGELLKVIASLPMGMVVLPGLDLGLDEKSWISITDTHPQATMRNLLVRMDKKRKDVILWPECVTIKSPRAELIRAVMLPSDTFGYNENLPLKSGLSNLQIVEASHPREEASVIALALREVLENPEQTACFITPDRILARRVMTALHRWGIEVDDSAGGALATTKTATFLVSLLRVIEENFAPLPLLDFLKHNYQNLIPADNIEAFEKYILRGSRPKQGLQGIRARIENKKDRLSPHYLKLIDVVVNALEQNFSSVLEIGQTLFPLNLLCESLIEIAEVFTSGKEFLWTRPESNAISQFIGTIIAYSEIAPPMTISMFGAVFRELLIEENYRADDEPHRRILILGQLESRLINRDVIILGGLNEGTWPRDTSHDPWMSKPMRVTFGLPSADRGVGLAAHDFAEHLASEKVIITRSLKSGSTATVPARWIQKLRTLLKAEKVENNWAEKNYLLQWARNMDNPLNSIVLSAHIPKPCPPLNSRPQELSATWIEKWMKNPYRVYAEKILKLRLLDVIDKDSTFADRGSFVHDILLDFVRLYPSHLPHNAQDIILQIAKDKLGTMEYIAPHWIYWWPRFEKIVEWFVNEEQEWRKEAIPWIQEEVGHLEIYKNDLLDRQFKVTAKADRIDQLKLGGVAVIDYKTGTPPTQIKIKNGTAPQLPIEAYICGKGGYRNSVSEAHHILYWKLSGSHAKAGEVFSFKKLNIPDIISSAEDGLLELVQSFENVETPYIAQNLTGRLYDDEKSYAHLARMAEWASGDDEDENEEGEK